MKAYSLIRQQPWYRREAFASGLRKAGYEVLMRSPDRAQSGDVLVIWNRYAGNHEIATRFEHEGGRVFVAENGYVGHEGTSPKFDVHPGGPQPHHYYALAWGGHNGQGAWPMGDASRLEELALPKESLRGDGHVLVLPNRSFGIPGRIMPSDWPMKTAARLRKQTKREVRVRAHPGNNAPKRPLTEDLKGAWATVVWTSGAGVHAIIRGIPTFCDAPFWIMKGAAASGQVDEPTVPDQTPHLVSMAWAQWKISEIESGAAFAALLKEDASGNATIR